MTKFTNEVAMTLAEKLRELFNAGADAVTVQLNERALCEMIGVKYDVDHHDFLFCAYYVDGISTEQLIGGIAQ